MGFKIGDKAVFHGHRVTVIECSAIDCVRVCAYFGPNDDVSGWLKEYDLDEIPALEQLAEQGE